MLVRYQTQPSGKLRVDAGSALSRYLSSVYVPGLDTNGGSSGGGAWDRKGRTNLTTISGTPTKSYGAQGTFYADNASGFVSLNPILDTITAFPVVLVAAGYFNSAADAWCLVSMGATAGGTGSSRCEISLASSTQISYVIRNNFGTTATVAASGLTGVNAGVFFCCVAQSRSATDHNLYINGTQYTSATNMGALTNPYNNFAIGGFSTGGAPVLKLDGGVLFAGYGKIALPDSMALELSRSPRMFWQMFSRQGGRYTQMAGAAAAGGFFSRYYYDMTSGAANV